MLPLTDCPPRLTAGYFDLVAILDVTQRSRNLKGGGVIFKRRARCALGAQTRKRQMEDGCSHFLPHAPSLIGRS